MFESHAHITVAALHCTRNVIDDTDQRQKVVARIRSVAQEIIERADHMVNQAWIFGPNPIRDDGAIITHLQAPDTDITAFFRAVRGAAFAGRAIFVLAISEIWMALPRTAFEALALQEYIQSGRAFTEDSTEFPNRKEAVLLIQDLPEGMKHEVAYISRDTDRKASLGEWSDRESDFLGFPPGRLFVVDGSDPMDVAVAKTFVGLGYTTRERGSA